MPLSKLWMREIRTEKIRDAEQMFQIHLQVVYMHGGSKCTLMRLGAVPIETLVNGGASRRTPNTSEG